MAVGLLGIDRSPHARLARTILAKRVRGQLMPTSWKLGGAGRPLLSPAILSSHGIRGVDEVGPADIEILATGSTAPLGFRDGTLIRTASGGPWVISDGLRRLVTTGERFAVLGYRWSNVHEVSDFEASLHPVGDPL